MYTASKHILLLGSDRISLLKEVCNREREGEGGREGGRNRQRETMTELKSCKMHFQESSKWLQLGNLAWQITLSVVCSRFPCQPSSMSMG